MVCYSRTFFYFLFLATAVEINNFPLKEQKMRQVIRHSLPSTSGTFFNGKSPTCRDSEYIIRTLSCGHSSIVRDLFLHSENRGFAHSNRPSLTEIFSGDRTRQIPG